MPDIKLRNIEKRFGDFVAVEDLNLDIEDGAFITLLGPSGCGKTTTLRMIAGLETPTTGEITIDGRVVFSSKRGINVSPADRNVGFLFQNYALWPHMTVYQNIAFGLETQKWSKPDIRERVAEMLGTLQIEQFSERYPSELSGGQQQRVAIARTLAPKPKVLFMDEPLSNLDAKLRADMRTELKRLHVDTNSTFIYVTHDQLEAMSLSTKICLMNKGVVQQYDSPLTVYERPSNLFVADFVGNPTINVIKGLAGKVEDSKAPIEVLGHRFEFVSEQSLGLLPKDVFVGIRPEFITICEGGVVRGHVYSTLPAGMETTVKVDVGGEMISSVVFGSRDFLVDSELGFGITGDKILLFDAESGCNLAVGSLSYIG